MPNSLIEYRLRIRNAADTADVLVVTSVRGDALPYIAEPPHGDGAEFDPLTGAYRSGSTTVRIADAITSGTSRVLTSQLEDASQRQQLASRPAYVEYRTNGGAWTNLQAGIITGIRLPSAAVFEIDVGDTARATRNLVAFAPKRDAVDATKIESLASYLARWPNRGCLAGGPVLGGFLGRADLGGWEMTVADAATAATVTVNGVTTTLRTKYIEFVAGYTTPSFARTTRIGDVRDTLNQAMGNGAANYQPSTFAADLEASVWRDVIVQIDGVAYAAASIGNFPPKWPAENGFCFDNSRARGFFVWDSANALVVNGTVRRVRVFDALPSERCPIYYSGHPVDLWMKLCDEAGLTYDATAAAACKDALGRNLRINLRIVDVQPWAQFVEGTLYGLCGFSARTDPTGRLVPFTTRITASGLPAVTLTSADVPQNETMLFELTEADAVTRIVVEQTNLITALDGAYATPPIDGVEQQAVSVIRSSGDGGGPVQREQTYRIPGFLDTGSGSYEPALVDALARGVFDRRGRGRLVGEITALRGGAGDSLVLGQEVVIQVPALPNHNKRYGDDASVGGRVMQILRLTEGPDGKRLRLEDSGPNAQPATPVPTLAIGASSAAGGAFVTITNAATLNSASIGARLQWAQTSGAAPAAADYVDVGWFDYGKVPTGAIALPQAVPGQTVYVQARSEQATRRPSAWSGAVSVATAGYGAPTALVATADATDGSRVTVSFAIGSGASALVTDVFVRLQTAPASADVLRATLPGGSVSGAIEELAQSTAYTVSVQHRDPATGAVSAKTTAAVTTSAAIVTLPTPTQPVGVVGRTDSGGIARIDGTYGLNVFASVLPSAIEYWIAVETGVGTGVYSTAGLARTVSSVSGGPTMFRAIAPNDGRRRSLTARTVRPGATASAFTTAIVVNPWGTPQSPPIVGGPIAPVSVTLTELVGDPTEYSTTVHLDCLPGTTPLSALTYTLTRKQQGRVAPQVVQSGGCGAFPLDVAIAKHPRYAVTVALIVTDSLTGTITRVLTLGPVGTDGAYSGGAVVGQALDNTGRDGTGGLPIPGMRFHTAPIYDGTGSIPLTDPVTGALTPNMKAADLLGPPDSTYMTRRRSSRGAGHAIDRTDEDDARGGDAGLPTPGQQFHTQPIYDAPGANPLLDTVLGRIGAALAYPGGTGIDALRPQEAGANVTETRTSNDTSNVGGRGAATVRDDARYRGPRNAGHTRDAEYEDDARSGTGGVPVRGQRYQSDPYYTADGANALLDPATGQITPNLLRPSDAKPLTDVVQRLRSDGQGVATFGAQEGSQVKYLSRGYQRGTAVHNQTITFNPAFNAPPTVRLRAGSSSVLYEPRTTAGIWTGGVFDATQPQRANLYADSITKNGFRVNAQLKQTGGTTANNYDFPAGNSLTAALQQVFSPALAAAPSASGHYFVRYKGSVSATGSPGRPKMIDVTIVVNRRAGGSTGAATLLWQMSYSASDPDGTGPYTTLIDETLDLTFAGMGTTDVIEITISSLVITGTGPGTTTCSVHGVNPTDDGVGNNGVRFFTGAADAVALMTPDAGSYVEWEAWAIQP